MRLEKIALLFYKIRSCFIVVYTITYSFNRFHCIHWSEILLNKRLYLVIAVLVSSLSLSLSPPLSLSPSPPSLPLSNQEQITIGLPMISSGCQFKHISRIPKPYDPYAPSNTRNPLDHNSEILYYTVAHQHFCAYIYNRCT